MTAAELAAGVLPLARSSPMPLWAQLESELRRRLAAGHFADRFPTDKELTELYGVSRHTARQAVDRLVAEGLVERRRGHGSFVVDEEIEQPLGSLYSLFQSVEARGVPQRSTVLDLDEVVDADAAAALGVAPEVPLVHLARVRWAGEEPLALDDVWLLADVARPLLTADFTHTALYAELAGRCGLRLDSGWERIHAVVPDEEDRALLDLPDGQAAFRIERLGRAAERPVEWRVTLIRGDRYRFLADWGAGVAPANRAEPLR